jgi:hypothetical protein
MNPKGMNRSGLIRRKLLSNPGLLDCAFCGRRVETLSEAIMDMERDDAPICPSCFELLLKNASQNPEYRKVGPLIPPA